MNRTTLERSLSNNLIAWAKEPRRPIATSREGSERPQHGVNQREELIGLFLAGSRLSAKRMKNERARGVTSEKLTHLESVDWDPTWPEECVKRTSNAYIPGKTTKGSIEEITTIRKTRAPRPMSKKEGMKDAGSLIIYREGISSERKKDLNLRVEGRRPSTRTKAVEHETGA